MFFDRHNCKVYFHIFMYRGLVLYLILCLLPEMLDLFCPLGGNKVASIFFLNATLVMADAAPLNLDPVQLHNHNKKSCD